MTKFTSVGEEIAYRAGRYVVALTWVREGAYFVEVRTAAPMGVGRRIYEASHTDEFAARADARMRADIITAGL